MKVRVLRYALLVFACYGHGEMVEVSAQSAFDPVFFPTASRIREHLRAFTDRSVYVVDEYVNFRVDYGVKELEPGTWSTVLYAELVTSTGKSVSRGKFPIQKGFSAGFLPIPKSTLTGNYFLKCYTRWMRNTGPATFAYVPLKIINPNRIEVDGGSIRSSSDSSQICMNYRQGMFSCVSDVSVYEPGTVVDMQIMEHFDTIYEQLYCCVTVVPAGGVNATSGQLEDSYDEISFESFIMSFLPDLGRGPLLSGTVLRKNEVPAEFATLYFSLLGEEPDLLASITDAQGRFALSSPVRYGPQEFYVCSDPKENEVVEIKIDQDFDNAPVQLPLSKFELSEKERDLASRLSLCKQFSQVFSIPEKLGLKPDTLSPIPFYGTSVDRINLDDYVNLPTLEEVFINLVPSISIERKRGKSSINFDSESLDIGVFPILILIDNIAILDQEAVLSLPSNKIDRIEWINRIYNKGIVSFGGLIAIYSKNGDMAGIDIPPGAIFFDYLSLNQEETGFGISTNPDDHIPDSRNTILWLENVLLEKDHPVNLSFKAPLLKGEYEVLVRAVAPNKEVLSAASRFTVE